MFGPLLMLDMEVVKTMGQAVLLQVGRAELASRQPLKTLSSKARLTVPKSILKRVLAAATAATRIVDQEVDAAQLLERAVHQFHEVFILQDMAFHGDRLHVDGFDLFGRLLCVLQIEIAGP